MNRGTQCISGALALILAVGGAIPATALDGVPKESEFRVELEQTPLVADLDLAAEAPVRIAELERVSVRDPRQLQQISEQSTTSSRDGKLKRAGRYMKKRWWIPVLIGVAVGVWVLEPFDDDDDERRAMQMNP